MTSKIDRLLGSKTRVTMLSKLMMNPNRRFYLRELSKAVGIPYSMVYKEEKNLVSLGILSEEKKGKLTIVSVNKNLPYFDELKGLITKTAGLGDLARDGLSKLNGIRYALIYGSLASGEETESSDVDLLVIGDVSEEKIVKTISQLEEMMEREVNYILWSEKEFKNRAQRKHHLLREILRKPRIMLVGDEDEFRRTAKK